MTSICAKLRPITGKPSLQENFASAKKITKREKKRSRQGTGEGADPSSRQERCAAGWTFCSDKLQQRGAQADRWTTMVRPERAERDEPPLCPYCR